MSLKEVAIAGGTGTIGQSIVSALLTKPSLYTPIILSRATTTTPVGTHGVTNPPRYTPDNQPSPVQVEVRYVDYTSLDSLTAALKDISTLLSTLLIPSPDWPTIQLNLLHAAISAGVQRFTPSEFALSQKSHELVDLDHGKITVWKEVQRAVEEGKIDAAAFPVGMFMNYLGVGIPDQRVQEEARAGFKEGALMFHLHLGSNSDGSEGSGGPRVDVPLTDDGGYPDVTMTDIRDVGRYIVAALGMEENWGGRELGIAGDTVNLRDIIDILQERFGGCIVERKLPRGNLEKLIDQLPEEDILGRMDLQYLLACGRGGCVVDGVLNRLCPEVKSMKIREFVERYWPSSTA